jgi:hypothetical protein
MWLLNIWPFRKKPVPPSQPICVHDWHLISTGVVDYYNGVDVDYHIYYLVGCTKCNHVRRMDELEYSHFTKIFDVKNRKENS